MTDRDLMQQALDALENLQGLCTDAEDGCLEAITIWTPEIIDALRERLAQPEKEIDWKDQYEKQKRRAEMWRDKYEAIAGPDECVYPAQPEQEPVAWGCNRYIEDDNGFQIGTDEPELAWGKFAPNDNGWWPLYTALQPAQPLTNEQLEVMAEKYVTNCYFDTLKFARAIEAAHGIK